MEREKKCIDYNEYIMTNKEKALYTALAASFIFVMGYIFYHSIILSLFLTPIAFFYPRLKTKDIINQRKKELNLQFKDLIYSLSSSLSAGKPLESSFYDALSDLSIIYPEEDTLIIEETTHIISQIQMNEPIENILCDFAQRSHIEDIKNFADVIKSCKKAGGNLVEVIRTTTGIINDKIEIKNELETMLAEKKLEQKLMSIAPIFMIFILSISAKDYMEPIFSTIFGRIAMTISMTTIAASYFISMKIIKIEI